MEIPKIRLNDGNEIPVLGLGTWHLNGESCIYAVKKAIENFAKFKKITKFSGEPFENSLNNSNLANYSKFSIELGYRHIDTAEIYGNENEIGKAISGFNRKELFITSKVFPFMTSNILPLPFSLTYKGILKACEKSLLRLKTDYLDLYLIHWPRKNKNMEYLKACKKLIDDGKIKSFGVSNFTINHLKDMIPAAENLGLKISVNQVEFHPLLYQKELLEFCREQNIAITAYSPLARGRVFENKIIQEISSKYNKTPGQISLKWLLQKEMTAIPKASSEKHLIENLNIFDFILNEEDIKRIDNINENKRVVNPVFAEFDY